jgi:malonate transporter and related proteins
MHLKRSRSRPNPGSSLNSIAITVLPVFGMIMLGLAFAKARIIDEQMGRGIGAFVFSVAVPALLFKTVSTIASTGGAPWGLWIAFYGGLAITWGATSFAARHFADLSESGGAAAAMAASFGNLALLGTPLALAHFGEQVAIPLGLILSIHAPILWTAATLHRELSRHSGTLSVPKLFKDLFINLATNAIVLALALGSLWRATGLGLTPVVDKMLDMLAAASIPTALFALGVSLSAYSLRGRLGSMSVLIALKMLLLPFIVFMFTRYVVEMPPLWTHVAILFAAMPSGANAFLFAQRHNEAVPAITGAITVGTALAAVSSVLLLYLMDRGLI